MKLVDRLEGNPSPFSSPLVKGSGEGEESRTSADRGIYIAAR